MFERRTRSAESQGAASVDGRTVGKALAEQVRPLLKSVGFDQFSGRNAWRRSEHTIDLVTFRSFSAYVADGVGCTTHSFTAEVGVFYLCFNHEGERPKEYELTFRATLGKTLRQPIFHPYGRSTASDRPDVWFVTQDGGNLSDCVVDALGCLEHQGLPFMDRFMDPRRAFDVLMKERSTATGFGTLGVHMPGNPDSSRWREVGLGVGHLFMDDPRTPMRTAPVLASN
jgi:hypothetical protein